MDATKYLHECEYLGMIMVITCTIDGYFQNKDVPFKLIGYHPDSNTFSAQPIDDEIFEKIGIVEIPNMPVSPSMDTESREFIHEGSWEEADSEVELVEFVNLASSNQTSSARPLIPAPAITSATPLVSVFPFIPPQGQRLVARSLACATVLNLVDETVSSWPVKHPSGHSALHSLSQALVHDVLSSTIEKISSTEQMQERNRSAPHQSDKSLRKSQTLAPMDAGIVQPAVLKSMVVEMIEEILENRLLSTGHISSELEKLSITENIALHDEETTGEGDDDVDPSARKYSWDIYIQMVEAERDSDVSSFDNILDISRKNHRLLHLVEIGLELANITAERVEKFDILPKIKAYKTDKIPSSPLLRKKSKRKRKDREV